MERLGTRVQGLRFRGFLRQKRQHCIRQEAPVFHDAEHQSARPCPSSNPPGSLLVQHPHGTLNPEPYTLNPKGPEGLEALKALKALKTLKPEPEP